jgi:hypothetical protein
MVKELSYTTISSVMESWEMLKRTKNYEVVAGSRLFQRYVHERCARHGVNSPRLGLTIVVLHR